MLLEKFVRSATTGFRTQGIVMDIVLKDFIIVMIELVIVLAAISINIKELICFATSNVQTDTKLIKITFVNHVQEISVPMVFTMI